MRNFTFTLLLILLVYEKNVDCMFNAGIRHKLAQQYPNLKVNFDNINTTGISASKEAEIAENLKKAKGLGVNPATFMNIKKTVDEELKKELSAEKLTEPFNANDNSKKPQNRSIFSQYLKVPLKKTKTPTTNPKATTKNARDYFGIQSVFGKLNMANPNENTVNLDVQKALDELRARISMKSLKNEGETPFQGQIIEFNRNPVNDDGLSVSFRSSETDEPVAVDAEAVSLIIKVLRACSGMTPSAQEQFEFYLLDILKQWKLKMIVSSPETGGTVILGGRANESEVRIEEIPEYNSDISEEDIDSENDGVHDSENESVHDSENDVVHDDIENDSVHDSEDRVLSDIENDSVHDSEDRVLSDIEHESVHESEHENVHDSESEHVHDREHENENLSDNESELHDQHEAPEPQNNDQSDDESSETDSVPHADHHDNLIDDIDADDPEPVNPGVVNNNDLRNDHLSESDDDEPLQLVQLDGNNTDDLNNNNNNFNVADTIFHHNGSDSHEYIHTPEYIEGEESDEEPVVLNTDSQVTEFTTTNEEAEDIYESDFDTFASEDSNVEENSHEEVNLNNSGSNVVGQGTTVTEGEDEVYSDHWDPFVEEELQDRPFVSDFHITDTTEDYSEEEIEEILEESELSEHDERNLVQDDHVQDTSNIHDEQVISIVHSEPNDPDSQVVINEKIDRISSQKDFITNAELSQPKVKDDENILNDNHISMAEHDDSGVQLNIAAVIDTVTNVPKPNGNRSRFPKISQSQRKLAAPGNATNTSDKKKIKPTNNRNEIRKMTEELFSKPEIPSQINPFRNTIKNSVIDPIDVDTRSKKEKRKELKELKRKNVNQAAKLFNAETLSIKSGKKPKDRRAKQSQTEATIATEVHNESTDMKFKEEEHFGSNLHENSSISTNTTEDFSTSISESPMAPITETKPEPKKEPETITPRTHEDSDYEEYEFKFEPVDPNEEQALFDIQKSNDFVNVNESAVGQIVSEEYEEEYSDDWDPLVEDEVELSIPLVSKPTDSIENDSEEEIEEIIEEPELSELELDKPFEQINQSSAQSGQNENVHEDQNEKNEHSEPNEQMDNPLRIVVSPSNDKVLSKKLSQRQRKALNNPVAFVKDKKEVKLKPLASKVSSFTELENEQDGNVLDIPKHRIKNITMDTTTNTFAMSKKELRKEKQRLEREQKKLNLEELKDSPREAKETKEFVEKVSKVSSKMTKNNSSKRASGNNSNKKKSPQNKTQSKESVMDKPDVIKVKIADEEVINNETDLRLNNTPQQQQQQQQEEEEEEEEKEEIEDDVVEITNLNDAQVHQQQPEENVIPILIDDSNQQVRQGEKIETDEPVDDVKNPDEPVDVVKNPDEQYQDYENTETNVLLDNKLEEERQEKDRDVPLTDVKPSKIVLTEDFINRLNEMNTRKQQHPPEFYEYDDFNVLSDLSESDYEYEVRVEEESESDDDTTIHTEKDGQDKVSIKSLEDEVSVDSEDDDISINSEENDSLVYSEDDSLVYSEENDSLVNSDEDSSVSSNSVNSSNVSLYSSSEESNNDGMSEQESDTNISGDEDALSAQIVEPETKSTSIFDPAVNFITRIYDYMKTITTQIPVHKEVSDDENDKPYISDSEDSSETNYDADDDKESNGDYSSLEEDEFEDENFDNDLFNATHYIDNDNLDQNNPLVIDTSDFPGYEADESGEEEDVISPPRLNDDSIAVDSLENDNVSDQSDDSFLNSTNESDFSDSSIDEEDDYSVSSVDDESDLSDSSIEIDCSDDLSDDDYISSEEETETETETDEESVISAESDGKFNFLEYIRSLFTRYGKTQQAENVEGNDPHIVINGTEAVQQNQQVLQANSQAPLNPQEPAQLQQQGQLQQSDPQGQNGTNNLEVNPPAQVQVQSEVLEYISRSQSQANVPVDVVPENISNEEEEILEDPALPRIEPEIPPSQETNDQQQNHQTTNNSASTSVTEETDNREIVVDDNDTEIGTDLESVSRESDTEDNENVPVNEDSETTSTSTTSDSDSFSSCGDDENTINPGKNFERTDRMIYPHDPNNRTRPVVTLINNSSTEGSGSVRNRASTKTGTGGKLNFLNHTTKLTEKEPWSALQIFTLSAVLLSVAGFAAFVLINKFKVPLRQEGFSVDLEGGDTV